MWEKVIKNLVTHPANAPLMDAYADYIDFLCEELDELTDFASAHGWKSKRFEQAKVMRAKIKQLQKVK